MSKQPRFKIELDSYREYAVFRWKPGWFGGSWERLCGFNTHELAREFVEKAQAFPEFF